MQGQSAANTRYLAACPAWRWVPRRIAVLSARWRGYHRAPPGSLWPNSTKTMNRPLASRGRISLAKFSDAKKTSINDISTFRIDYSVDHFRAKSFG